MMKRLLFLSSLLLCNILTLWAVERTYNPTLDVNFRTAAGNTSWQTVKDAAVEGNNNFELNLTNGFFALQKYTVADLQNASKLVLTLTVGNRSGVDAVRVWTFADNTWTAASGIDDIVPLVAAQTGIEPRGTGTANTPLVTGVKVTGSDPAKATFTISGTALSTIKANASADGTFTLLLTNDNLTSSGNNRSYLSNNSANDEANRPTLVATLDLPTVKNVTTGVSYNTLTEAFNAAVSAGTDAELEVYDDQSLSGRLTLNKAMKLTITPKADITIKGAPGMMWFLVNISNGVFNIGSTDHKITLDGEGKTMTVDGAVIQRENNGTMNVTNVEFKDFDLGNTARLLGDKQQGGVMTIQDITVTNCTNPKGGYIYALRIANDALVLKGAINIDEASTGIAIYKQAGLKSDGTTEGRIKVAKTDDEVDFTASKVLTIDWVGLDSKDVFVEGAPVVVGINATTAAYFKLNSSDWTLKRKNNDLQLAKAGWLDPVAGSYTHPGLLHTAVDITRVKGMLTTEPFKSAYSRLEAQSGGSAAGAVEYLKRMDKANWESTYSDYSNFRRAVTDAKLAYELALRYQLKNSTASATAAVNILNDWATNCKGVLRLDGYTNSIPDPNEYLILIQAYQFANAAELLRGYSGWNADDFTAFKTWMRETFGKLAYEFLETHHGNSNALHYWLNWDLAALTAMYSVGVLCDDKALVDYALNYVDNGTGTGNKSNAIVDTHSDPDSDETLAQCQESGRDQGHSTLDVTLLGVFCQMAQSQGTDLWTPYKALEMAEYVGKYNLKDANGNFIYSESKVPFTTYNYGEGTHTAISADARGTVRPSWELFHAYARNNNKLDIYTGAWVNYQRQQNIWGEAEGTSTDELGFGTLMFGEAVNSIEFTVTDAGAATLVLPFGAALPTGVKAYTLSYSGGDKVTATEVTKITANQPVLINAEAGNYTFTSNGETNTNAPAAGALTGVYASTVVPSGSYILTLKDGKTAFRKADGSTNTVAAYRAYLTAAASAAVLDIDFGFATGIRQVGRDAAEGSGECYNLQGQRVAKTAKGLYIVNGKKVIVK